MSRPSAAVQRLIGAAKLDDRAASVEWPKTPIRRNRSGRSTPNHRKPPVPIHQSPDRHQPHAYAPVDCGAAQSQARQHPARPDRCKGGTTIGKDDKGSIIRVIDRCDDITVARQFLQQNVDWLRNPLHPCEKQAGGRCCTRIRLRHGEGTGINQVNMTQHKGRQFECLCQSFYRQIDLVKMGRDGYPHCPPQPDTTLAA